jgi:hypothetical protein
MSESNEKSVKVNKMKFLNESAIGLEHSYRKLAVVVHSTKVPTSKGTLAVEFMRTMLRANPEFSPVDAAKHAANCSQAIWDECLSRDWLIDVSDELKASAETEQLK